MKPFYNFLSILLVVISVRPVYAQLQKGTNIYGSSAGDNFGQIVCMPDSSTIAVGAYWNDDNGNQAGHVRIFRFNGVIWEQKGSTIVGDAAGDQFGGSISMPDSMTIGIGATENDGNGTNSGQVRIFRWNGNDWVQKGFDIYGESIHDNFGSRVSMPDSTTIAVGAINNDGNGVDAGSVRIYSWNGSAWIQKGMEINGEAAYDFSGYVDMADSATVAIGAFGNGFNTGHVRVFTWNGFSWQQKGQDINGEAAGDRACIVDMANATTLGIGAWGNDGNGTCSGHVRVYEWNGSSWIQKGADIDGEADNDYSGISVSMADSITIAIGALYNDGGGLDAGHVRIYKWNGSAWQQKGVDIDGTEPFGEFGYSVSMADKNNFAVGAPENNNSTGLVQVYTIMDNASLWENSTSNDFIVSPNPTNKQIEIQTNKQFSSLQVILRNSLGQAILNKTYFSTEKIELSIENPAGIYFLEVIEGETSTILKVIKE